MRKLLTILLFIPLLSQATVYYVSLAGNGTNNGTSPATPWDLAKLNSFTSLSGGDTIKFNWNDKWAASQLKMTRTGSLGNPIVYTYYNRGAGTNPTFSGFTQLSSWTSYGNGVYGALCPGIKQTLKNVLLDGAQQTICRYPNSGYLTYTNSSNGPATLTTSLTGTPDYTGCGIVIRSSHFTFDSASITTQSAGTLTLTGTLTYLNVGGNGFFLTRRMDLMDQLGEFMPSPTTDSLRMYFGGVGPSGHTVYASVQDTVCIITGAHIKVIGLNFEGGNLYNAFNPFGSGDIAFDSCSFDNGASGADLYTANCTVTNSNVRHMLNNGITGALGNVSKYMVVSNCLIRDIGYIPGMGRPGNAGNYQGIRNEGDGCQYINNTVKNIGYSGINFRGDSTVVLYNYVDTFCNVLDDGGGIYTWNSSDPSYTFRRRVDSNYVAHGIGAPAGCTYDQGASASGIYFDTHSKNANCNANTLVSCVTAGLFIHGSDVSFRYNELYDNKWAQIFLTEFSGVAISSDVIKSNRAASPDSSVPCIRIQTPGTDVATMAAIDSNFYASQTGAVQPFWTKSSGDPGTFRSFSNWKSYLNADAQATYQTGKLLFVGNAGQASLNTFLKGRYQDLRLGAYNQLIPLAGLQGKALFELDKGYITVPAGTKIIPR